MIHEPWSGDHLNRKADAEHLLQMVLERYEARRKAGSAGYTLNLDARWGEGKTYFLQNLQAQLAEDGRTVAMVNAWQDDHGDDPLTSVIAAIDEMLLPFAHKDSVTVPFDHAKRAAAAIGTEALKQVGFHFIKMATGIGLEKLIEQASDGAETLDAAAFEKGADAALNAVAAKIAAERVANHKAASRAIETFRSRIRETIAAASASGGATLPMFVFIDELDRCRPLYAIKMLEDIKHLFSIEGLIFIVATDSEQLAHSVKAIYGEGFDSNRYLRRFFDRVFVFPKPSKRRYLENLALSFDIDLSASFYPTLGLSPVDIFETWTSSFKWSNRDLEQMFDIIATYVASWNYRIKVEPLTLLKAVGEFYTFGNDSNQSRSTEDPYMASFEEWRLPPLKNIDMTRGHTTEKRTKASNVIATLKAAMTQPVVHAKYDHEYSRDYMHEERNTRGPLMGNDISPSFLTEVESRVSNAGRHIVT
ncbi:KAP family NTPase [Sphingomonas sp. S1-29]|uniref:KAP family P-loop NTPase fold protein n=1 Tax=Sphingomonas sp. S1-29 TaxID=2991074 RepID=UPI00223F959E|nr:P-loop NTPase fold protein [Sphingomonas sp. S1-29]UZK70777.1 KAP family NTPase [Sphingomonas sp. S1-29]